MNNIPDSSLTLGSIGAGPVAQTIARLALAAGHRVVLSNSRTPDTLDELVKGLGENASAGTVAEAVQADIVLLAVDWDHVPDAVRGLDLSGRIMIDPTNQWHAHDPADPVDLGDVTGSEHIAALVPGARVVKAFNTVNMGVLAKWMASGADERFVIFIAGDDAEAKAEVAAFVDSLGLEPVDLGGLPDAGRLMQSGGPLLALHLAKVD